MDKITLRVGPAKNNRKTDYNRAGLIKVLEDSIVLITKLIDNNIRETTKVMQNGLASGTFWKPSGHYDAMIEITRNGSLLVTLEDKIGPQWAKGYLHGLIQLRSSMEKYHLALLENDRTPPSTCYIIEQSPQCYVVTVLANTKACCPRCGAVLHPTSIKRHVDSPICRIRAAEQSLEPGWERIHDVLEIDAIKEAGVEHITRPTTYATWAPTWAKAAIKGFKKNRGYASLRLKEYLKKMKDDAAATPVLSDSNTPIK